MQDQPCSFTLTAAALEAVKPQNRVAWKAYHGKGRQGKAMLDTVARSRRLGAPSTYFLFLMLRFLSIASLASAFAFSPVHARTCGTASFYGSGDGFASQTMANGQPMNPAAMITAHPSLPLGSRISVRNPANGKSVRVTVTDRGPFYGNRILDLSAGAFSRIASTGQGLVRICYKLV